MERLLGQRGLLLRFALGSNPDGPRFELLAGREQIETRHSVELRAVTAFASMPGRTLREPGVRLEIGQGDLAGQAAATWLDSAGLLRRVDELSLPGSGLHVVPLELGTADPGIEGGFETDLESRTVGALGPEVVARFAGFGCGVIGVGRTGTRVARALAQFRPRQLALVDPDVVEAHNLPEVDGLLGHQAIGRRMVRTLAECIREQHPELAIDCIETSVWRCGPWRTSSRSRARQRLGACGVRSGRALSDRVSRKSVEAVLCMQSNGNGKGGPAESASIPPTRTWAWLTCPRSYTRRNSRTVNIAEFGCSAKAAGHRGLTRAT